MPFEMNDKNVVLQKSIKNTLSAILKIGIQFVLKKKLKAKKNFVLPSDPQTCLHGLLQIHGDEEHVPL